MLIAEPAVELIDVAVVPMGAVAEAAAIRILAELRGWGVVCDMAFKGNMKKRMHKADAGGAAFAVILGDDEIANGVAAVKNLSTGAQENVALDTLHDDLNGRLARLGRGKMAGWTVYATDEASNPA
jgi:histidyl-tRNA synthetase